MYVVEKINKRIVIVLDNEIVYSMPFWVQIKSRLDMQQLADQFNAAGMRCIDSIMAFETKHKPS
jgi:hypothetical protein